MKTGLYRRGSLTILLGIALSPLTVGAVTLHVGSGDANDLKTIQAAVDAAVDGDSIVLSPGTYSGAGNRDVNLRGKIITIQGADPLDPSMVEKTIIDCAGALQEPHRAFYILDCNDVVISGVTIANGLATAGGGVFCQNSTLDLMYCRIVNNAALPGDAAGDPSGGPGGGLYGENSVIRVIGCLFQGNAAGDGVEFKERGAGAGGSGGAICAVKSDISLVSSTLSGNTAGAGSDAGQDLAGAGGDGGGIFGNSVRMADCTLTDNQAGAGGAGARGGRGGRGGGLDAEVAILDRCVIQANRAGDGGIAGADANDSGGSGGEGGGIYSDSLEITNSLIAGNRAGQGHAPNADGAIAHGNGGGIWCATGTIRHCTIAENAVYQTGTTPGRGAGLFVTPKTVVTNSVLYGNTPGELAGFDCNNVTYCNIERGTCPTEDGNNLEDPAFVRQGSWVHARDPNVTVKPDDPNAVWVAGDYRLQAVSRWVDAGDPNYVPMTSEKDLDGNPRVADAAVDIGAYEFQNLRPVYRFWSEKDGKHFYTLSETERDKLLDQYADVWTLEGPAFLAFARPSEPNLLPVYRFWSGQRGGHFYTIKEKEKDKLINEYAQVWIFEGIAFYAYPEGRQPVGTKPVHRFWSGTLDDHFFTIKEKEKDKLVNEYANVWLYEGIAWYAFEIPGTDQPSAGTSTYDFSGGPEEAQCTITLKARLDGKELKIDKPEIVFTPTVGYLRMKADFDALQTSLEECMIETQSTPHEVTVSPDEPNSVGIPLVLTGVLFFWGQTPRGSYGIDPKTLAFPTTGGGSLPGGEEAFTVTGSVVINGSKLELGRVYRAASFETGDQGVFDTSALPDRLNIRMADTFRWFRQQPDDLLLETTVKGGVLQLYIASVSLRTTGLWQGKPS